jgi:hypothetical protein
VTDELPWEPPAEAIIIGDGHAIVFAEYQGETAGINEWHRKSDGTWCCGWAPFNGSAWVRNFEGRVVGWDVVQREPLTITPSLLCRACGNHGFITNGKWVKA